MSRFIVAFDEMDREQVLAFLKKYENISYVKIGPELFYTYGSDFIKELSDQFGKKIFLDLKLHDIPNTVSRAITALKNLPLEFLTVHISGGTEMLRVAHQTIREYLPRTLLTGVSVLTSLGQKEMTSLFGVVDKKEIIRQMAMIAKQAKVDALVCPACELATVSDLDLIKICPGIRFQEDSHHDQKEVTSPLEAIKRGADFLVMGRSLTQSSQTKQRN